MFTVTLQFAINDLRQTSATLKHNSNNNNDTDRERHSILDYFLTHQIIFEAPSCGSQTSMVSTALTNRLLIFSPIITKLSFELHLVLSVIRQIKLPNITDFWAGNISYSFQ